MFCLFIFDNEYLIIKIISNITTIIDMIILFIGKVNSISIPPEIDLYTKYDNIIPIGIPINSDFNPYKMLSSLIILLNSLSVIPIDFNIANSLLLKFMLVVIVLNIFVIPIKDITVIKP